MTQQINAPSSYAVNMIANLDEEKSDLFLPQIWWNYRLRFIQSEQYQMPYFRLWPNSKFMSGDPVNGSPFMIGQDNNDGVLFEPWSVVAGGNYRPSYLQGQCTMADGVTALASVAVDLYLSSTNALVSSGITDTNGNYNLPTPYAGQNHYIYANYNNGTYVGASVATLQPNF